MPSSGGEVNAAKGSPDDDVQPPGDDSLWVSAPFEPEIRDGWIYARGAADDKIHLYMLVRTALDLAAEGRLPVNVRIVCDGDEESDGGTIVEWLRRDTEPVDFALCFDGMAKQPGEIVFFIAKRGLCFYTIEVEMAIRDIHSGLFGGVALNAMHVLNDMLAAVVPCPEELAVRAMEVSDEQTAEWDAADDWQQILAAAGGRPISADVFSDYSRVVCFRPSVDVNGVVAGDAELDTTIIPATARANISIRLAPGQEVDVVCPIFEDLLYSAAHPEATVRVIRKNANPGNFTNPELPAVRKVSEAFTRVLGRPPVMLPSGSSVPVMAGLDERKIPSVLTGFGLPDSAFHAPNERFPLAYLPLGMSAVRESLLALGENSSESGSAPEAASSPA